MKPKYFVFCFALCSAFSFKRFTICTIYSEGINLKKSIGVVKVDGMLINAEKIKQIVKPN